MFNVCPIGWSQHRSIHTHLPKNRHSSDLAAVVCPFAAQVIQRTAKLCSKFSDVSRLSVR
jgi:hypothetical protein